MCHHKSNATKPKPRASPRTNYGWTPMPTFSEKPQKQINPSDLSSSDVASLKTNDAFMYYSIPSARKAAILNKPVDMQREVGPVTRQSRISFECYGDLLLEDLINDTAVESNSDTEPDNDLFMAFLESCKFFDK